MGLRMAYWFGFAAVAGAFGGLIAFGVQQVGYGPYIVGVGGEWDWKVLFLIEVSTSVLCLVKRRVVFQDVDPLAFIWPGVMVFYILGSCHFRLMFRVFLGFERRKRIGMLIPFTWTIPRNVCCASLSCIALSS